MKVTELSMSEIKLGFNHRDTDRLSDLTELMGSLKEVGSLIHPVSVELRDGAYVLISGYRRYHAAKALGWKKLPASVVSFDSNIERIVYNHDENVQSKAPSIYELGTCYAALRAEGLTVGEISVKCNVPKSQVTRCLRLYNEVPKDLQPNIVVAKTPKDIKNGKVSSSTATEVFNIARQINLGTKKAGDALKFVGAKRLNGKDLRSFLVNVSSGQDLETAHANIADQRQINMVFMVDGKRARALEKKHGVSYRNIILNFLSRYPEFGLNKFTTNARTRKTETNTKCLRGN